TPATNVVLTAPGSSIRYTTTTTNPTCTTGTIYTTPIHITVSTTIKAIACYGTSPVHPSAVATFAYTITPTDTTAPVISAISSGTPLPTSATITWTTNESANSQVNYGLTTAYGSNTTLNPSLTTAHSAVITGLTAGTTYHYRVRSADASSNLSVSTDHTFITPPAPTYPAPTANPPAGTYPATPATNVVLTAPGSSIRYTTTTTNPTCTTGTIYTTPIHITVSTTIKAIACYGTSPVNPSAVATFAYVITTAPPVDTVAPIVAITLPLASAVISSPVPFSATASDAVGVVGVQFKSSMSTVIFDDTTFPYTTTLNTTSLPNGPLTIYAVARDAAGNKATSTRIVTVSNLRPAPTANPPAGPYESARNVTLTATGASIHYTIGATTVVAPTCTTGTVYSTAIHVALTKTIKAIACYTTGSSAVATFAYVISATGDDTVAPTIAFTYPVPGANISGFTVFRANASDNVDVVSVTFKSSQSTIISEDTAPPYSAMLNTTTLPNTPPSGFHAFYAVAMDAAGNKATSTVRVRISPPSITVTPAYGTYTSRQTIRLRATGSDRIYYTMGTGVPQCTNLTDSGYRGILYDPNNPIVLSAPTVIKAIACDADSPIFPRKPKYTASNVESFPFEINDTASLAGLYGTRIAVSEPVDECKFNKTGDLCNILRSAVEDTQIHLKKITGIDFPVQYSVSDVPGIQFILASSSVAAPPRSLARLAGKGFEAFVIDGNANRLKIVANNARGLAHGTYDYLEQLGVRWLSVGKNWTIVPNRSSITIAMNEVKKPDFDFNRTYSGSGHFSIYIGTQYAPSRDRYLDFGSWNRRMRFSYDYRLGKQMGEAYVISNKDFLRYHPTYLPKICVGTPPICTHTPLYIAPFSKRPNTGGYVLQYPLLPENRDTNWYIKAATPFTGTHDLNIVAMTNAGNPDAVEHYCDWIVDQYERVYDRAEDKTIPVMSVMPADGAGEGNNTAELVRAGVGDGSPADQQYFIKNKCMIELASRRLEFSNTKAATDAYANYSDPPSFGLNPNIVVQLAAAFRFGPHTRFLSDDEWTDVWRRKLGPLGILARYDFWSIPDWSHDEPSWNYLEVGPLLRKYYSKNIKGFHTQSTFGNGAVGLPLYIGSRLMWDIDRSDTQLIDEWYTLAFGPAKAPMKRMLERWSTGYYAISAELSSSYRDLDQAVSLAGGNTAVRERIYDYVRYVHYLRLRNEEQWAIGTASAPAKGMRLAEYILSIAGSNMIDSLRNFDLLAYPAVRNGFHINNGVTDPVPDGPGWARVRALSNTNPMTLLQSGKSAYPTPDFTIKKFTGNLVPVATITWTAPVGDPWGSSVSNTRGVPSIDLQMLPGMTSFHFRVSRNIPQSVTITNSAGTVVYRHQITKAPGTPAEALAAWDEMTIPLSPGHYKVKLGGSGYKFATWKGTPLIIGKITASGSGQPKLYFYVPRGLQ
ncbi:MAG: FN3 associated domain-containing protein, partial [Patescibacteria group bacterium]